MVIIRYRAEADVCSAGPEPTAPEPAIRLSVAPSVAPAGTMVTATVVGGDPEVEIIWRLDSSAGTSRGVGSVILDATGSATFQVAVPSDAIGEHSLELVDWGASATLDVMRVLPTAVRAGGGPVDGLHRGPGIFTALLLATLLVRSAPLIRRSHGRAASGA